MPKLLLTFFFSIILYFIYFKLLHMGGGALHKAYDYQATLLSRASTVAFVTPTRTLRTNQLITFCFSCFFWIDRGEFGVAM